MIRYILFSLFLTTLVYSAYIDSDIDGVEDKYDKCSHTPFDKLVDEFGCSKSLTYGNWLLTIGTELGFDDVNERSSTYNFFIQYTYNQWNINLSNTNYIGYDENENDTRENGDIYATVGYKVKNKLWNPQFSIGMKIPAADTIVGTGENDYYLSLQFTTLPINNDYTLFSQFTYTFTGDSKEIEYKNIFSYNVGIGYYVNSKYFTSFIYENSQSIYEDTENYKALIWSNHYAITSKYFMELEYRYGLDSFSFMHNIGLKLGVSFE